MPKNRKFLKMFCKNLCDKVSTMKNLRLLSSSFFRARRRGVLHFFGRRIFHGENRETNCHIGVNFRQPTTLEGPGAMNMASKNMAPKNPDVPKPQIENTIETFDTNNHIVAVSITSKSVKTHLAAKKCCGW